jgi:hypothetical protein
MLRVLQGAEAAGPVAPQLGQPDERDVFAYTSKATGTTIFFRQGWQASGNMQWEWSTDKQLWIPTCHVSPAKRLSSKLRCMVSQNQHFICWLQLQHGPSAVNQVYVNVHFAHSTAAHRGCGCLDCNGTAAAEHLFQLLALSWAQAQHLLPSSDAAGRQPVLRPRQRPQHC